MAVQKAKAVPAAMLMSRKGGVEDASESECRAAGQAVILSTFDSLYLREHGRNGRPCKCDDVKIRDVISLEMRNEEYCNCSISTIPTQYDDERKCVESGSLDSLFH